MLDVTEDRTQVMTKSSHLGPLSAVDNLDERRRELLIQVEAALKNGGKEPGALKVWAAWLRAKIDS